VSKLKKKIIIGVIIFFVIVGIIGAAGSSDKSGTTSNQTNNTQNTNNKVEEEQPQTVMDVVTADFIADFDKNQLAAEEKYKGKIIKFAAKVKNISEDVMGNPFLSLVPVDSDQYYFGTSVQCIFEDKSALTSLENGQTVTVQGTADVQTLGIIGVKKCQVVQ
jgi:tRNA_anti-like